MGGVAHRAIEEAIELLVSDWRDDHLLVPAAKLVLVEAIPTEYP